MRIAILATVLSICLCTTLEGQVSQYSEQIVTSQETWTVNGDRVNVRATVITGAALFTVHVFVDYMPSMDSAKDRLYAKRIVEYAISHGYLENAYLYNNYGSDFHVRKDVVGVALIKVVDEKAGTVSGARFAFTKEDLALDNVPINAFELPKTFTLSEKRDLRKRMKAICDSRNFDEMYSLFSKRALADIVALEESKKRFRVQMSLSKEIAFGDNDFTIYIGSKAGVRGYDYFVPIAVTPYADPKKKLSMFFKVLIVDQPTRYEIYGIEMNFIKEEDFHAYMGKGKEVEFPVNSR